MSDVDQGHPDRWRILIVLCAALCIVVLDNTILGVAIPRIGHDLGADETAMQWITTAYGLVLAALLLPLAGLGDRFGRKGLLLTGVAIFGVSSAAAAFASSPLQLAVARGCQGVGGAATMPATLAILGNVFAEHERAKAIAVWSGVSALAAGAGPIVGGALLGHFWWGSVFLVNVPITILVFLAAAKLVPTSKDPATPPVDVAGSLVWAGALALLLISVIEGPVRGWGSPAVLGAAGVGVVLLAAFAWWERRTPHPLLSPSVVADHRMQAGMVAIPIIFFAVFGAQFVLAQWLQGVQQLSPLGSGLVWAPAAATILIGSLLSTRFVATIGAGRTTVVGMVLFAGALFLGAAFHGSLVPVVVAVLFVGLGNGLSCPPAVELIMGSAPPEQAGQAAGINETIVEGGGAFGVAVMGSVLAAAAGGTAAIAPEHLASSAAARANFDDALFAPLVVAAVLLLVGAGFVLRRVRGTSADRPDPSPRDVVGAPEAGVIVAEPR